jgi:GntR family transcriptional regulator
MTSRYQFAVKKDDKRLERLFNSVNQYADDPENQYSLYYKIFKYITISIEDKQLKPGDALPSERKLEELYHVSRTTVRKALDILERKGYIEKHHGKGNFVANSKLVKGVPSVASFTKCMTTQGMEVFSKVLEQEIVIADLHLQEELNLYPGSKVFYLKRLRYVNKEPLAIASSYLPFDLGLDPDRDYSDSLFGYLYNGLEIKLMSKEEVVEASSPTHTESQLLNISIEIPVLRVTSLVNSLERPIELCKQVFRSDRYKFRAKSQGNILV